MDSKQRIEALVGSAIWDSYNSALKQVYKDIYKERTVVWMTTQRSDVCIVCQDLHGTEFNIDETEDLLPQHPQCRCTWVSLKELKS
jgi:SPP1 gp7 family putative phage head morphogenesis protein